MNVCLRRKKKKLRWASWKCWWLIQVTTSRRLPRTDLPIRRWVISGWDVWNAASSISEKRSSCADFAELRRIIGVHPNRKPGVRRLWTPNPEALTSYRGNAARTSAASVACWWHRIHDIREPVRQEDDHCGHIAAFSADHFTAACEHAR